MHETLGVPIIFLVQVHLLAMYLGCQISKMLAVLNASLRVRTLDLGLVPHTQLVPQCPIAT